MFLSGQTKLHPRSSFLFLFCDYDTEVILELDSGGFQKAKHAYLVSSCLAEFSAFLLFILCIKRKPH